VIVAGLIFASAGNLGLRVGFDQLANLPDSAASVRGYEELSGEFPGGVLAPVNVLVRGENLDEKNRELLRLQSGLQAELLDAGGSALTFGPQYAGSVPEIDFVTPDGSAARVLLVFDGAPFSPEALDQARRLQERLPTLLEEAGLEDATGVVGGQTALSAAARDTSAADLERVAPLLFVVSFVVLALLLRTPVAPIYLVVSTALSFAATLGVCTVLFQNVLGRTGSSTTCPSPCSCSWSPWERLQHLYHGRRPGGGRGRPLKEAVPAALARTGPTINAAGLTLAASFSR
jgi:RND superfamily putative drug exporter